MSIETWKAEFYPTPAEEAIGSEEEALRHSLHKWQGGTPENLEKHGLKAHELDDDGHMSTRDCALCHYTNTLKKNDCKRCPLTIHTGQGCAIAYRDWLQFEDPTLIITQITDALNTITTPSQSHEP